MKHIKKHPINDKAQKLSKDMKKQELVKPKTDKKLDADKSLSDPDVSMRVSKPSNKKLDGEKFLSENSNQDSSGYPIQVLCELSLEEVKWLKEIISYADGCCSGFEPHDIEMRDSIYSKLGIDGEKEFGE